MLTLPLQGGGNSSRPNSAGSAAGSIGGARHGTLGGGGSAQGGLGGGVARSGPSGANLQELLAERWVLGCVGLIGWSDFWLVQDWVGPHGWPLMSH